MIEEDYLTSLEFCSRLTQRRSELLLYPEEPYSLRLELFRKVVYFLVRVPYRSEPDLRYLLQAHLGQLLLGCRTPLYLATFLSMARCRLLRRRRCLGRLGEDIEPRIHSLRLLQKQSVPTTVAEDCVEA